MYHIAILDKKRRLLEKVISKEKTIESRWYKTRRTPWNNIRKGDVIYFKNSGELITVKADVKDVLFFDKLNKELVLKILKKYGKAICMETLKYTDYYKKKNYCILMFLENVREIKPFNIDKKGFGNACAWITLEDIKKIKIY
jgi:S-adenosylmethionine:tRNA-ribosyltransferase-isomerase (queuine synthetase)